MCLEIKAIDEHKEQFVLGIMIDAFDLFKGLIKFVSSLSVWLDVIYICK